MVRFILPRTDGSLLALDAAAFVASDSGIPRAFTEDDITFGVPASGVSGTLVEEPDKLLVSRCSFKEAAEEPSCSLNHYLRKYHQLRFQDYNGNKNLGQEVGRLFRVPFLSGVINIC